MFHGILILSCCHPTPVFHRVQHYSLQITLTQALNWQDSFSLGRAGHGHIEDHYLIYILCTKLKFILSERVSPSPLIVPERLETHVCFQTLIFSLYALSGWILSYFMRHFVSVEET